MPGEYIAWVGHRMDYKGATSPLEQWTALEVRKMRAMLRQKKAEQDTWFEEKKVLKSGTRITKLEQAVSDLTVGLIVAILEKSSALNATDEALEGARQQVQDFLNYGRDMMLALSSYLASYLPGGGLALNASTLSLVRKLVEDIDGAFCSYIFTKNSASRPLFPDNITDFFMMNR